MPSMNQTKDVQNQYADDKNLAIRIKFHEMYSVDKRGIVGWMFEQYHFAPGDRMLELGCGNGNQWNGRIQDLPKGCTLHLSDFSEGMVGTVKEKYAAFENVSYEQIDIQNIPYEDDSFDVIIANHMLYHVPDLDGALAEVRRVLKTGGRFYASTNSENGLWSYLCNALHHIDENVECFAKTYSFTLQNGYGILRGHFEDVKRLDYVDALDITNTQDLIDWICSTISLAPFSPEQLVQIYNYFEAIRLKEGVIHIPKEAGMFVST
ncbi:MAG: class I SAM-dependent methyltransferase [Clostridiales bacterium]|nr:class I SAM-dependent methyltransferase [Clostridiales bacterium]